METTLENMLSSGYKKEMMGFLKDNPSYTDEAIRLALTDKQPSAWRAALIIKNYIKKNDPAVQPYISDIINVIPSKKDGHQRELIKILLLMELNEEQEGFLFDICATIWEAIENSPSLRSTAFLFMTKITTKYPDLTNEILLMCNERYLTTLSPGIKKTIVKTVTKLSQKH